MSCLKPLYVFIFRLKKKKKSPSSSWFTFVSFIVFTYSSLFLLLTRELLWRVISSYVTLSRRKFYCEAPEIVFADYETSPDFFIGVEVKKIMTEFLKTFVWTRPLTTQWLHSVMQSSKPVTWVTSVWVKCCCQNCLFDSTVVFIAAVASDWSDSVSPASRNRLTLSKCKKKKNPKHSLNSWIIR